MLITAAGTIAPATLLVLGAGVAGLSAIGAGAAPRRVVEAFDVRKVVKEQVESLGAKFVEVDSDGGRADRRRLRQGGLRGVQEEAGRGARGSHVAKADVVITPRSSPASARPSSSPRRW